MFFYGVIAYGKIYFICLARSFLLNGLAFYFFLDYFDDIQRKLREDMEGLRCILVTSKFPLTIDERKVILIDIRTEKTADVYPP